ncbi:MAG: tetratricopeptide repeat protein [Armatimonadetes bacterium]|nr:tetratricopeptide repeat protein [Armatimonadota bacterium]
MSDVIIPVENGQAAMAAGHLEEAVSHFRRALSLEERNRAALTGLRHYLLHLKQYQDAEEVCVRGSGFFPEDADFPLGLGDVYRLTGRHWSAAAYYEIAVQLDPGDPVLHMALARMYDILGRSLARDRAVVCAERLGAEHTQVQYGLGWMALTQGRIKDALRHFQTSIDIQPNENAMAHLGLAECAGLIGNHEEQARHLDRAASADPSDPSVLVAQASLQCRLGQFSRALEVLDKAAPYVESGSRYWEERGQCLLGLGRFHEGRADALRALDLDSTSWSAALLLMRCEMKLDNTWPTLRALVLYFRNRPVLRSWLRRLRLWVVRGMLRRTVRRP